VESAVGFNTQRESLSGDAMRELGKRDGWHSSYLKAAMVQPWPSGRIIVHGGVSSTAEINIYVGSCRSRQAFLQSALVGRIWGAMAETPSCEGLEAWMKERSKSPGGANNCKLNGHLLLLVFVSEKEASRILESNQWQFKGAPDFLDRGHPLGLLGRKKSWVVD